jgi:hypothetical protein
MREGTVRPRRQLASPATANVLGGVAVVVVAAVIWLDVLIDKGSLGQDILNLVIFVTYGAVGVVVARAQPRNPLGWLMLWGALGLALSWRWRRCSIRYGAGCSGWWTAGFKRRRAMSFHRLAASAARDAGSSRSALRVVVLLPPVPCSPRSPGRRRANREH